MDYSLANGIHFSNEIIVCSCFLFVLLLLTLLSVRRPFDVSSGYAILDANFEPLTGGYHAD